MKWREELESIGEITKVEFPENAIMPNLASGNVGNMK